MEEEVVSRASAWTAAQWGKKCLERGCVYIKDYVIVEGGGGRGGSSRGRRSSSNRKHAKRYEGNGKAEKQ